MMISHRTIALGILAAGLLASADVAAAPYCAVFSYGRQCWYYSYDACLQAAGTQGVCIINPNEVRAPSSGAPFCVVTSTGANCWYYDAQSCRQAAQDQDAV